MTPSTKIASSRGSKSSAPVRVSTPTAPVSSAVSSDAMEVVNVDGTHVEDNDKASNVSSSSGKSRFAFTSLLVNPLVIHVVAELIVIGCISALFYRKTRSMQAEIDALKAKVASLESLVESVEDQGAAIQHIARVLQANGISLESRSARPTSTPAAPQKTAVPVSTAQRAPQSAQQSAQRQPAVAVATATRGRVSADGNATGSRSQTRVAATTPRTVIERSTVVFATTASTANPKQRGSEPSIVEVVSEDPSGGVNRRSAPPSGQVLIDGSNHDSSESDEQDEELRDSELDAELEQEVERMTASRPPPSLLTDLPSNNCNDEETCSLID